MRQIVLENFLKQYPQVPQYSEKNQHYLISGVNPLYYLTDGTQEEQIAPLAASLDWQPIVGSVSGNIVHMVSSTGGTFTAYAVTDTTKVYGLTAGSVTDLGYPSGSSNLTQNCYLAIGANSLFMTNAGSPGQVFYMSLPQGTWSSFGTISQTSGVHIMEPFSDHIAISDGTTNQSNLVKLIDPTSGTPTILTIPVLNLGAGFGVTQMRNFNDKYLAVAFGKVGAGGIATGYPQNYICLWDTATDSFNYSMKVPGKFIDMKVVDSVLYVAVQVANDKTCIYQMRGTNLQKVFTTQISTISTGVRAGVPCSLFDFKNYLGILLSSNTDLAHPVMVYGNDESGGIEFIHSSGRNFDQFVVDYNGNLIVNEYVPSGNSNLYYYVSTGSIYQTILYKSQWIPVKNLQALDINYDSPPAHTGNSINVTVYGRGEDIITGSSTTVLNPITPTTYLNAERTRLDVKGFTGDKVKIQLSTAGNDWGAIIRKIVLIAE